MRANDPYSTIDKITQPVSLLKESGLLLEGEGGGISLSLDARSAIQGLHAAAREHVARLMFLPISDLETLAFELERSQSGVLMDPVLSPRPGSHLAGSHSLAVFGNDAPAMVRIEQAIFDLWMAHSDAHIKAWRATGLEGPPMALFTHLWEYGAQTLGTLTEACGGQQTPSDVEKNLAYLISKEYTEQHRENIGLTDKGIRVRQKIEDETNRIYFASWPQTTKQAEWMKDKLKEMVGNIPSLAQIRR